MFTLTPTPNTYRQADNLMPLVNNQYETRPGFFQVASGTITHATGWIEALAWQQEDGNHIWHGGIIEPVPIPTESILTGTLFQSLTSLGNRENRLYLSNGNSLYYLHRTQKRGGKVTGVIIKPEEVTLLVGAKTQLTGEPVPKWAVNSAMGWDSYDKTIATVDDRGLVSALAEGEVVITATSEESGYTAVCKVTVTPFIPVTAVALNENSIELELPRTITKQLYVDIEPDNATNSNVLWRSYDKTIATVDEYGKITGIAEGKTTVVVMSENGGITDKAEITIIEYIAVTGVTVEPEVLELAPEETGQLSATVEPENASDKTIRWATDDESIASVNDNGEVTAMALGTVYITVITEEGSFADKCEVTVSEPV